MSESQLSKKEAYDLQKQEKNRQNTSVDKRVKTKRIFLWSSVLVGLVLSVWSLAKLISLAPAGEASLLDAMSATDWVKGSPESKNILVEYSDFQCPACKSYHPMVKKLLEDHTDNVRVVYRHFPLPQHQNAKPAAYASEAAGQQGKFWEMHDVLFEHQEEWAEAGNAQDLFVQYAASLGLDLERFKQERDSSAVKEQVEKDYDSGIINGINSTPTFFFNGQKIQPRSYKDFVDLVKKSSESR